MSDTQTVTPDEVTFDAEVENAPIEDGGQGEAPEATAPEPKYLDLSEFSDHVVRVKVDGQEIEVPVSELPNGYSRTQDYTRKAQALAEERRQVEQAAIIQRALEVDPQRTLAYLQEQYLGQGEPQADPYEGLDPVQARLMQEVDELRGFQEQMQYERSYADVDRRLGAIESNFGEVVSREEVLQEATRRQTLDLEGVAEALVGRKMWAQRQATEQHAATRTAEDQARQQAAADATALSSSSHNVTSPTGTYQGGGGIEGALDAAMKQLGMSDADIWGTG